MRSFVFYLILLSFLAIASPAAAQFEGAVEYRVENLEENDGESTNLNLTFTKDRIFILSEEELDVLSGISTSGVLVRTDYNDFIFLTGENEALQIKKDDLDGLSSMMKRMGGKQDSTKKKSFNWNERVLETGRSQTIHGYPAREFVVKDEDSNGYASIWLTDQIKINWGLLQKTWDDVGSDQTDSEIPVELIMNRNSFPLLIEGYKEEQLVFRVESVSINTGSFDRSVTEIPSGIQLLGFSDLMMNMFRQRR